MIGLLGGTFDPPHNGHVALLARAQEALGLDQTIVIVAAAPGHKQVETPAATRFVLARAAFPGERVVLDAHARTIEMLDAHPEWEGATFLLGADEFAEFLSWREPEEVLRRVRLGVAARPGVPTGRLDGVLAQLEDPARVSLFELEPQPIASRELRDRLQRGEDVSSLVPAAVWALIDAEGLYGRSS